MNTQVQLERKRKLENLHLKSELDRFNSQINFAEALVALHPDKKNEWTSLIQQAKNILTTLPELNNLKLLSKAVHDAECVLTPIGEVAQSYTAHCVGHAHIDMNWMWSWPETVAVTNDTFITVLKLMEEFPEFTFSQSQASVYKILEDYHPELLERVKEKVKEGRWEVTASHWVEGDKNIVGGETLARHLLYTRKYMKTLFGLKPEDIVIDWAPDTFGHAETVPAYLVKGGVKYCYLHRPGNYGVKRPKAFWWKSKDGSKVLVRNDMIHGYNGRISSKIGLNLIDFVKETKGRNYMYVYGIGDHGGGPTRSDLKRIMEMSKWPIFPTIKFSKALDFYKALEKEENDLPVLDSELNFEFTGCYTTQTQIKKANRFSETRLADAELAATLGFKAMSLQYPSDKLETSWRDCLFNHFHDILPGSGVRDTRHYTMGLFQKIMADATMIETNSLRKLISEIKTIDSEENNYIPEVPNTLYNDALGAGVGIGAIPGKMSCAEQSNGIGNRPFVLFNTTAFERKEVIEVTVWDNAIEDFTKPFKERYFSVRTAEGKTIPAQYITNGSSWGHEYVKLAFPVELSGFSYALYTIIETDIALEAKTSLQLIQPPHICFYATHERYTKIGCENNFIKLEINPKTGAISRLLDKKSGFEIISPANQTPILEYSMERPHGVTAWVIDYADKKESPVIKDISYETVGNYKVKIVVKAELNNSKFQITYEVQENNPQVNINVKTTWLENGSKEAGIPCLRIPFTFNLNKAKASYDIPFGAITRDLNHDEEVPANQWGMVTGYSSASSAGCLILNDCKYGYAFDKNTMRLTLIRSSYDPDPHPELGEHEANFALVPFTGEMDFNKASDYGQKFNHIIKTISTDIHEGNLPSSNQFINVSTDKIVLSGIKKCEFDDSIIVRFYEADGKHKKFKITFVEKIFGKFSKAVLVDLNENEIPSSELKIKDNEISVSIDSNSIISIKIS